MPPKITNLTTRTIATLAPQDTREILLRLIDWRRLFRKIENINPGVSTKELFAGVAWGITGTALLSLIPLYQSTQSTEAWVKPTYMIVALASFIIGFVIWMNAKDYSRDVKAARNEIMIDMKEIHCLYFPGEDLDKE